MSKTRRGKENLGLYVPLTLKMLKSKAYIALTPSAAKALPFFIFKGRYAIAKHGRTYFTFPYTEAEKLSFSRGTFFRVFGELIERGFIDPIDKPGGLRGFGKTFNKYALSERWAQFGEVEFKAINWSEFVQKFELKSKNGTKKRGYSSKNETEL